MFSIVYSSMAAAGFKVIDLAELVMVCRRNNAEIGVTGMLVYEQGQFLQAIEGPEQVVRELVGTIERDPRHEKVQVLEEGEIEVRRFPDWPMGYSRIDDDDAGSLADYGAALAAAEPEVDDRAERATSFLDWIRRQR